MEKLTRLKRCSVCLSDRARAVNAMLEKGTKLREISQATRFSKSAIHRHSQRCVRRKVVADMLAAERRDQLESELEKQYADAVELKARADAEGDLDASVRATRELRRLLALRARSTRPAPSPAIEYLPSETNRATRIIAVYPDEPVPPELNQPFNGRTIVLAVRYGPEPATVEEPKYADRNASESEGNGPGQAEGGGN